MLGTTFVLLTSHRCLTNCIAHVRVTWNCLCVQVCGCNSVHFGLRIPQKSLKIESKTLPFLKDAENSLVCLTVSGEGSSAHAIFGLNCVVKAMSST